MIEEKGQYDEWPDGPASKFTRIVRGNGNFYFGETKLEGKLIPHGRGVKVVLSVSIPYIIEATFKDGTAHGKGRRISTSGQVYIGDFVNDMFNGQGILTWPEGHRYEGQWKDNIRHGEGIFYHANGDKYQGSYV